MLRSHLLAEIHAEIYRHDFNTFVDESPSVAQGHGVVVAGCPRCRKHLASMNQFLDPLANEVMPALFNRPSEEGGTGTIG